MQSTHHQVKYILSEPSLLSIPIPKTTNFPSTNLPFPKHKPISLVWKKKRASGSTKSTKMMLQSAYFIASKLKILPEPLDTIIREFGGGENGGSGFRFSRGHGWGGFDGWKGKRKKINWGLWVFMVILGVGLWLILGKEFVLLGGLGLTLFGLSVNVWKRGVLDWALGFCCCAALVGFFLKKEDLQKLVGTIKIARRSKRRLF